ncbi:hypothetical protein Efla_004009 [Eimeria flavescens]
MPSGGRHSTAGDSVACSETGESPAAFRDPHASSDMSSNKPPEAPSSLFRMGPRRLHSFRRLKDLEEEDASLGTPQEAPAPSSAPSAPSEAPVKTVEGPKEGAVSESETDDDTLEVVRSMVDLQRMRRGRRKGLDIRVGLEEAAEPKDEEEAEDAVGLLEKNFATGGPGSAADRHLEEFLRERMKNKDHESHEEKIIKEHEIIDKMRDLYAIPDHLKVVDKTEEYKNQMNWVTGLVEVELPMENKLKNIEATEKAKRQLLRKGLLEEAEENPEDPDVVRKTAFGQRYTWYIPDYQFRKKQGQQKARDRDEVKQFAKRTKRMQEGRGRVGVAPM